MYRLLYNIWDSRVDACYDFDFVVCLLNTSGYFFSYGIRGAAENSLDVDAALARYTYYSSLFYKIVAGNYVQQDWEVFVDCYHKSCCALRKHWIEEIPNGRLAMMSVPDFVPSIVDDYVCNCAYAFVVMALTYYELYIEPTRQE